MKLKYFVMAAFITVMTTAHAQAAQTKNVTLVKRTSILEDSSEHRRLKKDYSLTAQVTGFAVSPVPAAGVNFGFFLNRNSVLQAEFSKGTLPIYFFNMNATTLGANYKHFFGNSFYGKIGMDYRSISASDINTGYTKKSGTIGEAESLVANVAIGNQWQWENFTLGCDWIGINPPLAVLNTTYNTDNTDLSDSDRDQLNRSWEGVAKVTSYQFLRFYLGASF
jgi:hypothetical protein